MMRNHRIVALAAVAAALALAACSGHGKSGFLPAPANGSRPHLDALATYSSIVLADGASAYYHLDDTGTTAVDASGGGYTGTIGSSVTKSVTGLIAGTDTAMSFPGIKSASGLITFPRNTKLEVATKVSLETWIRFTSIPATYTVAVAYGSDASDAPYMLAFQSGGKLYANFATTAGNATVVDPTPLAVNTTYHLVSTYDGTTAKLYVNGVLVGSTNVSGTLKNYYGTYGFSIGDDAYPDDPPFIGTIDEVAVYANTTLSAAQVLNHYNAGNGSATTPTPSPTPTATPIQSEAYASAVLADSPSAYYRLGDTGSSATDASGHSLNGAIGTSVTTNVAGLLPSSANAAMSFPGARSTAGVVSVPRTSLLEPANAVTLEAWIKFPTTPSAYTFVTGYGSDNTAAPYGFYFRTGGQITAQFALSGGLLEIPSSTTLSPNTAYHIVGTFDGTTGRIYVNGVQTGSASGSGTFVNYYGSYGLAIGDDISFGDPAFNGTIDEVAVYAGKALSATRVLTHYQAGTTGTVATPSPGPTPNQTGDWSTMGYDNARTGYDPNEQVLGANNASGLHTLWAAPFKVGGQVGEPAYASNVIVNGSPVNLLIVNSASGKAFAVNADTGAQVWASVPTGTVTNSCGTASFTFGPFGAPALDRARNRVYVPDGAANVHAFDLSTGAEISGWPVSIASSPNYNFIEAAVTYNAANGYLYAETSSTCDISPWYGRIVAIDTNAHAIVNTFYPTQGQSGGGIWGFGGASIDPSTNNVFIATGNADTTTQPNPALAYAEQIVELTPDVSSVIGHSYATLPASSDADYGATPLLFTPPGCGPLLAAVNKSGLFVLFNRSNISAGPTQTIQMSIPTDAGDFVGVPAYDPVTHYVYVGLPSTEGIYKPGLGAFSMRSDCTLNPTPVWNAAFGSDGATTTNDTLRSPMTIANGVVYISDYDTGVAYAFNASSGAQLWSTTLNGKGVVGPIVANGHLYTSDISGQVRAWTP